MERLARTGRGDPVSDTPDEVAAVQIEVLRRAGVHGRVALAFSMSRTVCALSRRAIERAHPGISDDDMAVAFVSAHYGAELAESLRAELTARRA
jgi:hypothetical protein